MSVHLSERHYETIGDAMTTAAALDRLVHHSVIVELNGASYRMEAAKKNQQSVIDGGEPPESTTAAAAPA
jgi:DNA replication protein DnaC